MAYLAYDGQTVVVVLYHGLNAVQTRCDHHAVAEFGRLFSSLAHKECRKYDSQNSSLIIAFIPFIRGIPQPGI